jgi:4-amino-4-deoxy-L-arabinose transferase-like glycosyltransferase
MTRFSHYLSLICLSLYLLGGVRAVPFHADEALHLMLAQDYAAYFVLHDPGRLSVQPPLAIDSTPYSRLLSGTVSAYLAGAMLWHTGQSLHDWPQGWYFPQPIAWNREEGRYPSESVLWRGRLASSLATLVGLWALYALARTVRGEGAGLWAAVLYALHPMILLNGRRVMQEGALLLATLLLLWWAGRVLARPRLGRWLGLGLLAGIALAVKPTALIALAGVGLGLLGQWRHWRYIMIAIGMAGVVFMLLTPSIWGNPLQHLWLAARLRAEALEGQTAASQMGYDGWPERLAALALQPFPSTIQYYESPNFAQDAALQADIRAYDSSWWAGLALPSPLGLGLAGLGALSLLRLAPYPPQARLTLLWVGLTGLALALSVPLAWGRYYLPWTLAMILLAGLGADMLRSAVWNAARSLPNRTFVPWP